MTRFRMENKQQQIKSDKIKIRYDHTQSSKTHSLHRGKMVVEDMLRLRSRNWMAYFQRLP